MSLKLDESQTNLGLRLPELLAPAGDWDCVKVAVENGADAVYFGLEHFNARMRPDGYRVSSGSGSP
jgi:U32 family peptidase